MSTTRAEHGPPAVEPFFFGPHGRSLYGCYGAPPDEIAQGCGVVLCPPVGQDYTRSHRALKLLADRLARLGFPVLRFDYHGCGDSAGSGEDARLAHWVEDVGAAAHEVRRRGADGVCLVGARLGGTLALLAGADAGDIDTDGLVLWDPVLDGRAYLGELEAAQRALRHNLGLSEGPAPVELLDHPLTDDLRGDIEGIEPLAIRRRPAGAVLLVGGDAGDEAARLAARLGALGVTADRRRPAGPALWAQESAGTLVPHQALEAIASWVSESCR
jgi:pimeloyl-ACP methyl ester carboxylesterase